MKKECCALFVRLAALDSESSGLRIMKESFVVVKSFLTNLGQIF